MLFTDSKFEKWWETYKDNIALQLQDGTKLTCLFAWLEAKTQERERCAKLAEDYAKIQYGDGAEQKAQAAMDIFQSIKSHY